MNLQTSKFQRSIDPAERRAQRLFKLDEHEEDPPVAFAASNSRKPAFIEQSEAAITTKYGAGIRYRGTEYLTNLTTASSGLTGRGQIMYALPISPNSIASTRLQLAAQMFTRYIFKSIKFYYMGTAPTTTAGSMMMFGDYDPSQNPGQTPGDGALRYSYTHNCSEFSVWQQACVEINDKVYEDMLYCDPDEELRWSTQGCFWLLSSGALPSNTELGKLIIEYEIDFAVPDFRGNIAPVGVSSQTITVGTGSVGVPLVFTGVFPNRGTYMLRVDSDPGVAVPFNVSPNAFNQGAPVLSLSRGMWFFAVTKNSNQNQLDLLWTPDVYALGQVGPNSIVASTANASTTFSATIFPLTAVSND